MKDTETFSELMLRYRGLLFSVCRRYSRDSLTVVMSFDGTAQLATFTFSGIEGYGIDANGQVQQMQSVSNEYNYDGTQHKGYLVGEDEDGNPANLEFTYDDTTDQITFVIDLMSDGATTATPMPWVFSRI